MDNDRKNCENLAYDKTFMSNDRLTKFLKEPSRQMDHSFEGQKKNDIEKFIIDSIEKNGTYLVLFERNGQTECYANNLSKPSVVGLLRIFEKKIRNDL